MLNACSEQKPGGRTPRVSGTGSTTPTPPGTNGSGSGNNNTTLQTILGTEILYAINPDNGSFNSKVTIPKNFAGILRLSGVNVVSLHSSIVRVKFKFGRDYTPVIVPGVITDTTGMTLTSRVPVIALDFSSRPFEQIRLKYDLYDYNNYNFSGGDEPVSDPKDTNLFCRGLNLEDDPTFTSPSASCDSATSVCKYAYAQILDKGLINSSGIPTFPQEPQVSLQNGVTYNLDSKSNKLKKCLPDDGKIQTTGSLTTLDLAAYAGGATVAVGANALYSGSNYTFQGPYLPVSQASWELTGPAIFNSSGFGLFKSSLTGSTPANYVVANGIQSLKFPRYGTMMLQAGIDHYLSALDPEDSKEVDSLLSAGESDYMDGCNLRVASYNPTLAEHIGSCNVTATIEIYSVHPQTGAETLLTSTKEVKIQIIRSSQYNNGNNVGFSGFVSCSSSLTCPQDSCCLGGKCWERSLVGGMCPEEVTQTNNLSVGDACMNDYSCQSLCCSQGVCAVHNTFLTVPVTCSKPSGGSCIAREWCAQQNITQCLIVWTDYPQNTTCGLRCYNKQVYGDCINGSCVAPVNPPVPAFNTQNPDCSSAVAPPGP